MFSRRALHNSNITASAAVIVLHLLARCMLPKVRAMDSFFDGPPVSVRAELAPYCCSVRNAAPVVMSQAWLPFLRHLFRALARRSTGHGNVSFQ
jgi:hypothetical protein